MKNALIIFVKAPQLGKVKTRIAKDVGDYKALEIYFKLLLHTRTIVERIDAQRYLYYAFEVVENDEWSTSLFEKRLQVSGNLGDKMKVAFSEVLSKHNKCIIIGSDCGELEESDITAAFSSLDQFDVVVGPAEDGGYYLLGMKKTHRALFDDMPWSSAELLTKTIEVCQSRKLSYHLLDKKSDVDYYEDWLRVKDRLDE